MQFEREIVRRALSEWGHYEIRQRSQDYYPSITPLHRFMTEGAPGKPIFTASILHSGTPKDILKVKESVDRLPLQQMTVIYVKYTIPGMRDEEKAKIMGITHNAFRSNLSQAQKRLLQWI